MITISNSEMTTWDRCPRKWLILYYLGFAPADEPVTGNRLLGIRVHTALEGRYGYGLDPLEVLKVLYLLEAERSPEHQGELLAEHDMANAMVSGYLEWVDETGADADFRVIATEADLQLPMPGRENEVLLRSRMDQVIERISDGALLFLDHKTSANFDRHELLTLDVQMPHYCMMQQMAASRQPGSPLVVGGIINTLRRVKRTSRSQPPYYQRDPIYCNPDQIATAWHRTNKIVKEILEARSLLDPFRSGDGIHVSAPGWVAAFNKLQREHMRAIPMINDCSWSCPAASGLCTGMSDGSDWLGMLKNSGHWKHVDPYEYYRNDPLQAIRSAISGTIEADQGDDAR
jgi:PD-(D/E)XK nuclease superfamily